MKYNRFLKKNYLKILSILILVFQFFLYKPFIDFLYPKKSGCNVIGTVEPIADIAEAKVICSSIGYPVMLVLFNF